MRKIRPNNGSLEPFLLDALQVLEPELNRTMHAALKAKFPVCDIIQETYAKACQNLETFEFRGAASTLAWLRKIARNIILGKIRRQDLATMGDLVDSIKESGVLRASELTRKKEDTEQLQQAILQLPETHRQVLNLRYVESASFEDIAGVTGRSASAIRGLHRNAIFKLRKILKI